MRDTLKKLSPGLFGLILISFLLPWVEFSCGGTKVASLTGMELTIGTTIQEQGMRGGGRSQKVAPEPLAALVLVCTIGGLVLSILTKGEDPLLPGVMGAGTLILLLFLKSKIEADAISEGQGMIQVSYTIGFWLALIFSIGSSALSGFLYFDSKKRSQAAPPSV